MREFGFELAVCAGLESEGELVSRQLAGGVHGSRVMDTVVVEPGPGFDARTRITERSIPHRLLESDLGAGTARRPSEAVGSSGYASAAVEAGVDCGYLERERRGGQAYVRATARYPDDWFASLTGVENKPDLGRPGDLELQLRKDVSLALFDRVWLATASHVTGAHLNRIPPEVGVWRVDPDTGERETVREATPLDADGPGIEVVDEHPGRTEIRPVDADTKARYRRRVAERAYGKGWRVPFPDCPHVEERSVAGVGGLAYCTRQERYVRPADACGAEGTGPEVDIDARRAEGSPWVRDPAGAKRTQAGLDFYSS
ncbi:DUF5787 family protein [Halosegnis marinus]|uniref:DUF5787 family protein n=1 Tax=Halosegnis marinus TaxID=3034023 RepID=A0ABD5ZQ73_9EURY|nr:DUF5787 family protein [Halosegnis sp. DT85]